MAASSIGSGAATLVALGLVCCLSLILLRQYLPLRGTPAYLLIPIFLSLVLPISTVLLVPIDLASSTRAADHEGQGIWLPDGALLVAWRIIYWLMFALTWFILPLLGEYLDSGYRRPTDRFVYSLKSNGRFWAIVLGCSAVAAVYVLVQNGFQGASFKALVMALAYCVGLIQAIYMMGHGLVAMPRRLVRNADPSTRLKRIYGQAPAAREKMEDALTELAELEEHLKQLRRKSDLSAAHRAWVEDIVEIASITRPQPATAQQRATSHVSAAPSPPSAITDRYLADLTRRLTRARHKRTRFVEEWSNIKQEAHDVEAIVNAKGSQRLEFKRPATSRPRAPWHFPMLTPSARYLLHARALPALRLVAAGVFALASVCVVWSEMVKAMAPKLSLVSLSIVHQTSDSGDVGFGGQAIAALWICYMCASVLTSFRDVKFWGNRALVRRNTYGESACFYAGQLAKLTVPLAYNFLTFIPPGISHKTTFYKFLGTLIDLTPLGDWFDNLFPIFILMPVCATLFNLYGKIKGVFRVDLGADENEQDGSPTGSESWREGRSLIEQDDEGALHADSPGAGLLSPTSAARDTDGALPPRGIRDAPALYIPPAEDRAAADATSRQARRTQLHDAQAQRLAAATRAAALAEQDDDDDNEPFFAGFAHRVKNTIDSVERPAWLGELGKRPKWMDRPASSAGAAAATSTDGNARSGPGLGANIGRWFGGRGDGQVRLRD